jgi:Ca2+-binding EF-hand superfamily protein
MPLPPMSPALDEVPEEATSAPAHIVEDEAQEVADEDASSEASSKKLSATPLRLDGDGTIPSQMRRALQTSLSRVIDLFRQFDDDASGYIDGPEFVKALAELGFDPDEPSVSALFASFDLDDSGTIEYEELHNLLVRSVQHKPELEPLELKAANRIALRKKRMSKVDANLFSGLELGSLDADAIPGAIRKALDERMVRVIDLFRQFDDDSSGLLDASEFAKAMRELGMTDAPPEAIAAVFASFDHDESGTIEYRELHAIMKRSLQDRPVVPLLGLQTANRITLRTKRVLKANANLLEGLDLDEAALHSIPGQIKGAMQASLVRVVDLFRQFDDDGDGRISFDEFGKAMGELGLDVLPQALRLLFDEWDPDKSGYIEYEELYTLLRHAK